ncbi:hypothetical protein CI109_104046 [Kwoniella shandongensis]|uniref:Uncharacterized protein n=1 Tax=Kwoniella shandongensis TaxID=1734106 RepID=A0A5M6C2R5_9TREE|nr:uncharacterized protein CI109_004068 [Kwoniella shandongensis]KAA5527529.1 hypothetical protein CI109_004068 [Kwoniella shandongensis]
MIVDHILAVALGVLSTWTISAFAQTNSSAGLRFGPINFAGYDNYVYRDNTTSAQIVITDSSSSSAPSRFIAAFPSGNTGALVYFVPLNSSNSTSTLGTSLDLSTVTSVSQANNQTGLSGNLSFSGDLQFGVTLIGSVRTLRDYVEGGGVFNSIFNYTLAYSSNSTILLQRKWLNGTTVQYLTFETLTNGIFNVTPNANVSLPPDIRLTRPNAGANATVRFTHVFNFTGTTPQTPFVPLEGLGKESLFLTSAPSTTGANNSTSSALASVLQAIQNNGSAIADQTAFLTYTSKTLAGGWRFLTYFGRDTLLALRLLLPVISPTAAESILGAVLERTNITDGTLCHEETIGDYASYVNAQNNRSELGNTPFYNYVMLDTDFLLLPVLAEYFVNTPQGQGRANAFLQRQSTLVNGSFASLLQRNVDHVIELARPFAQNATKANLVKIRDPTVGNWRDSGSGLGYGVVPFDVNSALIPSALRAIALLASATLLPANYSIATSYAQTWEDAYTYFQVPITPALASSSLNNYVAKANLSEGLLYGAGSFNGSTIVTGSPVTDLGWYGSGQTIGLSSGGGNSSSTASGGNSTTGGGNSTSANGGNSTFYALSLKADGTPVEVLNSDLGFVLLYNNNVSESVIQATIEALQPYPRGLLTNVGMVVANAAYDTNVTDIDTFNNLQYHGAVSWSWQQGLMASGLTHQLALCNRTSSTSSDQISPVSTTTTPPTWCTNNALVQGLLQAQQRLWYSIAGSAPALYTEVLSPIWSIGINGGNGTFTIGDLGAISPTGTEGDAIQLWSYGFLAQVDPRTGRPVAAGFA